MRRFPSVFDFRSAPLSATTNQPPQPLLLTTEPPPPQPLTPYHGHHLLTTPPPTTTPYNSCAATATISPQARAIEKQIQAAKARDEGRADTDAAAAGPTELRREEGQTSLRIGLNSRAQTFVPGGSSGSDLTTAAGNLVAANGGGGSSSGSGGLLKRPKLSGAFGEGGAAAAAAGAAAGPLKGKGKGAKRSMMEVMMEQERAKKKAKEEEEERAAAAAEVKAKGSSRKDYWLRQGIVVKVMNKRVGGGKYYKKKARLRKVVERYVGEVKMIDSGDRLRVDQDDLETVRAVSFDSAADAVARLWYWGKILRNPLFVTWNVDQENGWLR